jgi:hypothetical protein
LKRSGVVTLGDALGGVRPAGRAAAHAGAVLSQSCHENKPKGGASKATGLCSVGPNRVCCFGLDRQFFDFFTRLGLGKLRVCAVEADQEERDQEQRRSDDAEVRSARLGRT